MKKYKSVEVSETQLEDMIRRAPELIEAGLKYVDHQAFTERGPLDALLVDSGRSLVVAELKIVEDDSMLVQGIDYYDYITKNLDGYARAYKQSGIDPNQKPRLFLVAPSFSVTLLNRIKWIDIPISLFTYQCIKLEGDNDDLLAIYKEITAPVIPEKVVAYSIDDRYNYITDAGIRGIAKKLVNEIQSWDTELVLVEATKYSISIKRSGRVIAYVEPRRKHFILGTYDSEGKWSSYPINSNDEIETMLSVVRSYFDKVKASK